MTDRIQLTDTLYMPLDGQWQIVLPGLVCDVPSALAFSSKHITLLSPTEPAGALAAHGKPTTVRNPRAK